MSNAQRLNLTVSHRPDNPELLYDGDCSFCTHWAKRWQRFVGPAVVLRPLQAAESDYPELSGALRNAIHLVEPSGNVTRGAHALVQSLAVGRRMLWPLKSYERCSTLRRLSESLYRVVAAHRCRRVSCDSTRPPALKR